MMSPLSVSLFVFYSGWAINGAASQCSTVEICCAENTDLNTNYVHRNASLCSGRPLYEKPYGSLYLYYDNNYWQVQHLPCFYDPEQAMVRIYSMHDTYPEDVVGIWEESVDGAWRENKDITVVCYVPDSETSGTATNIIIGLSVGSVVVFFVLVPTFIRLGRKCMRKNQPSAASTNVITRSPVSPPVEQIADENLSPVYDNLALDIVDDVADQTYHSISFDHPPPDYENLDENSRPRHSVAQDLDAGTTFEPPPPSYEEAVIRLNAFKDFPPPYSSGHPNSSFVDEHDRRSTSSS